MNAVDSIEDRVNLLRFLHHFYPVSDSELELLAGKLTERHAKRGEILVRPGQIQYEKYFVTEGTQMAYYESDKKEHVVAFAYAPGLCAIPKSFSFQVPSDHYLKCLTDSSFLAISYENLQEVFDQSRDIERMYRKMLEHLLSGIIDRHIQSHAFTIEERFRAFAKRSPHLFQQVPHKYIASYLDIDPTNFSKLYNTIRI